MVVVVRLVVVMVIFLVLRVLSVLVLVVFLDRIISVVPRVTWLDLTVDHRYRSVPSHSPIERRNLDKFPQLLSNPVAQI